VITLPASDILTTGDAEIEINGRRGSNGILSTFIAGKINARRSLP